VDQVCGLSRAFAPNKNVLRSVYDVRADGSFNEIVVELVGFIFRNVLPELDVKIFQLGCEL
jgi:hypothetical protein